MTELILQLKHLQQGHQLIDRADDAPAQALHQGAADQSISDQAMPAGGAIGLGLKRQLIPQHHHRLLQRQGGIDLTAAAMLTPLAHGRGRNSAVCSAMAAAVVQQLTVLLDALRQHAHGDRQPRIVMTHCNRQLHGALSFTTMQTLGEGTAAPSGALAF